MQGVISRLLREPLVHFFGLSLIIMAVYWAGGSRQDDADTSIVVSPNGVAQLDAIFTKTWQRPPTAAELKGLVDDFVKEEIYVREAQRLGLDRDDTVIRRRLRLKMEFLSDSEAELEPSSEVELQLYLDMHAEQFASPPLYSFDQVTLRSGGDGSTAEVDARKILASLNSAVPPDARGLGDVTLLPAELEDASPSVIAQTFGSDFSEALQSALVGAWSGPIASTYGHHVVRLRKKKDGKPASLAESRDLVLREWTHSRRKEFEERRIKDLLARYSVHVPVAEGAVK